MKTPMKKLQLLTVTSLALFAALYIWSTGAARQKEVKIPKVISEAKNIEVVNVKVEEPHSLVVTLRNNAEMPVVAITLETGNGKDGDAVTVAGYQEGDEPDMVIIRPHDTYNLDMPLNYLRPDGHVRVSGVIYQDGAEEGAQGTLELMHQQKAHTKSGHLKQGGPKSQ